MCHAPVRQTKMKNGRKNQLICQVWSTSNYNRLKRKYRQAAQKGLKRIMTINMRGRTWKNYQNWKKNYTGWKMDLKWLILAAILDQKVKMWAYRLKKLKIKTAKIDIFGTKMAIFAQLTWDNFFLIQTLKSPNSAFLTFLSSKTTSKI